MGVNIYLVTPTPKNVAGVVMAATGIIAYGQLKMSEGAEVGKSKKKV